ncbi:MAG: RNA-binding protein [Prolixibacteraceae bacterium]|nr:RNA-binding protein [Prolixibacteraceae bacterium]
MNIYVGNLPFNLGEEDLKEIFEEYGEVTTTKIVSDKFSGRSKGFGFVEMSNDEEAANAIKELNNAEISGRNIKVNESLPKPAGESRGGGERRSGGGYGGDRRSSGGGYGGDRRSSNGGGGGYNRRERY